MGLVCANSYKAVVTHLDLYSRGKTVRYKMVSYMSRTYLGTWVFLGVWGRLTTLAVPLGPEKRIKNLFRSSIPTFRNLNFEIPSCVTGSTQCLLFPKDIPNIFHFSFNQVIYSIKFLSQYLCDLWHWLFKGKYNDFFVSWVIVAAPPFSF